MQQDKKLNHELYLLRALEAPLILRSLRESDTVGTATEGTRSALPVLVAPVALGAGRRGFAVAAATEPEVQEGGTQFPYSEPLTGPSFK